MTKPSTARRHRKELVSGLAGTAVAGGAAAASSVLGALNQPTWKLVVGSTLIAIMGFSIPAAVVATTQRWRVRWLSSTCVVLAALGVFIFWQLRRPAVTPELGSFTVSGSDVQVLYPSGAPGGPEDIIPPAPSLVGGSTYLFACSSAVGHGARRTVWLRLAGYDYWFPLSALRPTPGVAQRTMPAC